MKFKRQMQALMVVRKQWRKRWDGLERHNGNRYFYNLATRRRPRSFGTYGFTKRPPLALALIIRKNWTWGQGDD